jgi:hypothetical protein
MSILGYAEETPDFILGCKEFWADTLEQKHMSKVHKHELLKHPKSVP